MQPTICWWWVRHAALADRGSYPANDAAIAAINTNPLAEMLALMLPKNAVWLAAPELRSLQTAHTLQSLAAQKNSELTLLDGLRDQDFGHWTGKSFAEVAASQKTQAEHFSNPAFVVPESGESFAQTAQRVQSTIRTIQDGVNAPETIHIIAVAHSSTIRACLALALNIQPNDVLHIQLDPLSLTRMDYYRDAGGWMVKQQNWLAVPSSA